jgi:hypothetical protein
MVQNGQKDNDGPAWQFSAAEVSALEAWVKNGGGLIVLSGYQCPVGTGCTVYDTTAPNQLLSFTDIQFNSDTVAGGSCPLCYCWGGAVPLGAAFDGGPGLGTWDQSSPIGIHLKDVGSFDARSIHSTTASVDCTDGTNHYAVHEQIGQGHVFAYGDEWVTYSGEWLGNDPACTTPAPSSFTNPSDPCYQKSAAQIFQVPQFWYNAIKYAASSVTCFTISNPGIIQ